MHALMISTDRTVFEAGSPARRRMEEYAEALGALSVVVFSLGRKPPQIGERLSLYPTNSFSRFLYVRDAARLAEKIGKADVVTAQDPFETGLAGARIARRRGIPLHVQAHTDFLAEGFAAAHWPLNAMRLWIAPRVLSRAARIRAVSARIKEHIEARYRPSAAVSVLPIFADTERFEHIPRARHPRFKTALLFVSRLEKEKRAPRAIEALKKARDAGFDCGLTVVGSGREEQHLKKLAEKLGVAERVEFAGFQHTLVPYYAVADVLLYPGAPYEGYGMAMVEALAAGVPVLAHDVGVAREAGAAIVEGNSSADFGAALVLLLKKGAPPGRLLFRPYASKKEYLEKFVEDLALSLPHHE